MQQQPRTLGEASATLAATNGNETRGRGPIVLLPTATHTLALGSMGAVP